MLRQAARAGLALALASACGGTPDGPRQPARTGPVAEEVEIPVPGGRLAGTLLHHGPGSPRPAVLWVAGSGRTDRDGNNPLIPGRVDSYRVVAEALAAAGLVVLRYDKRGAGESPDWEGVATAEDLVGDVVAAFHYLQGRPEVDARRVALVGHSEGGLLSAMAQETAHPAALVLVAAPSRPMIELLRMQLEEQIPTRPEWVEAGCLDYGRRMVEAIESGERIPPVPEGLPSPWAEVFESIEGSPARVAQFRDLGAVDPVAATSEYAGPVLLLYGGRDDQVRASEGERLAEGLRAAGNQRVALEVIAEMDHVLKVVTGPEPEEYGAPGRQVAPLLIEGLASWLVEVLSA